MFKDINLQLTATGGQAITATAVSLHAVDLGPTVPVRDLGNGEPMDLVLAVKVAGDRSDANETYELQLIQATLGDLITHDVLASRPLAVAELAIGQITRLGVPPGAITKRYIGARVVTAGTTPTITAEIFFQPTSMASLAVPPSYAKGYTVS